MKIELFVIDEQIQNSFTDIGARIFEAKKLCKEQGLSYQDWCAKNIGLHHQNCNRIIRIYEVFRDESLVNDIQVLNCTRSENSFRKLDVLARLSEPIRRKDPTNKSKELFDRDENGARKFDTSKIKKFLSENPNILTKTLKELTEKVKEFSEKVTS